MRQADSSDNLSEEIRDQVQPRLIARIVLLVMVSTLFSLVLFYFLAPQVPWPFVFLAAGPFMAMHGVSLGLLRLGWPRCAAHVFIWMTILMQFMVTVLTPQADHQALVSYVNVVMAAGFMLGRRWSIFACIGAIMFVSLGYYIGPSLREGLLEDLYSTVAIFGSTNVVLVSVLCTLLTTGGLAYLGIMHLSEALHAARQHQATAESSALKLERVGRAETIRAGRAEILGSMARDIVTLRSDSEITNVVASTLTRAFGEVSTAVLGRDGHVLAMSKANTEGLSNPLPPINLKGLFQSSDRARLLSTAELSVLRPLNDGKAPVKGQLVCLPKSTVMLIIFGQYRLIEPHDVVWMLMAAAHLLDASIQRTRMEHTLSQSQRMDALGRLSAGIAHDFNNLLTSILGGVELARRRPGDATQVGIYLDAIQGSTERAAGLTHKLMAFTSAVPQQPGPVDVGTLVEDILPTLRRAVEESIEIEAIVLDDAAWVEADSVDLERILVNLVVNAREALTSNGKIDIGVEVRSAEQWMESVDGAVVVMWVEDDGVGMPQDLIEHIFEPFFTTHKDTGAAGLGLSIVYGLVHAMGGEIFVSSDPGEGTRFEVCLPHRLRPASLASLVRAEVKSADGHRILVVEDDTDVCATICGMLEIAGYKVMSAKNGKAAIDLLARSEPVSLVLSDVIMPEMGGFALYEAIQEMGSDVKMALVSGYAPPNASASSERPALPIISKPFSLNELMRFVGGVIG